MINTRAWRVAAAWASLALVTAPLAANALDRSKYMPVEELRRGMTGFGRTVLAGTEVIRFDVEIISIMRNAFFAKQDVILIRCKGAGLEHSGIIGGMSGSPVYITDERGQNPRMIGAVAYGWTFNKDPICGVQPISQMLAIRGVTTTQPTSRASADEAEGSSKFGSQIAKGMPESAHARDRSSRFRQARMMGPPGENRFSALLESASGPASGGEAGPDPAGTGLQPLSTPIMVAGASSRTLAHLRERLAGSGFEPVPSGGFVGGEARNASVKLEPGSVFCVPLMRGDMQMTALGTCTDVIGEKALAFGHSLFADGAVELPMATGAIHTVIPSVMRSNKIGAALATVGTLVADEQTGIFGRIGESPAMIPCRVTLRRPGLDDEFHYECVQHQMLTPALLGETLINSLYDHADLPREHTLRYSIDLTFENIGVFHSSNISSQSGAFPVAMNVSVPAMAMMENRFGKAKVQEARMEIDVEPTAKLGVIERAELGRNHVKPGAVLEVFVWWRQFRRPELTKSYTFQLPDDIPEGTYEFTICSSQEHIRALRTERPYFFEVQSMKQMLDAMNYLAQFQDDRVYLRLGLRTGGMSLGRDNLPDLPSYRQRILADSKRTDVARYTDALVVEYPVPFVAAGSRSFTVKVDKRADQ